MVKRDVYALILILSSLISGCVYKESNEKSNFDIDFSDMDIVDKPSPIPKNLTIVPLNNEVRIYNPCRTGITEIYLSDNTKSMDGVFDFNNKLILCKAQENDLRIGEIMVYNSNDGLIIHRIVGFRDNKVVFKGDNSDEQEYIDKGRVMYYLVGVIY